MGRHSSITPAQSRVIAHRGRYICGGERTDLPYPTCGQLLPPSWQIDHIVPLHMGGEDDFMGNNVVAICGTCHANKTQLESIERAKVKAMQQRTLRETHNAPQPPIAEATDVNLEEASRKDAGPWACFRFKRPEQANVPTNSSTNKGCLTTVSKYFVSE